MDKTKHSTTYCKQTQNTYIAFSCLWNKKENIKWQTLDYKLIEDKINVEWRGSGILRRNRRDVLLYFCRPEIIIVEALCWKYSVFLSLWVGTCHFLYHSPFTHSQTGTKASLHRSQSRGINYLWNHSEKQKDRREVLWRLVRPVPIGTNTNK